MRGSKYQPLTEYLNRCRLQTFKLSFSEIEQILGFKLPYSAFTYPVWWINGNQTTAVFWLSAGYVITKYSLTEHYAIFSRNEEEAAYHLSKIPEKKYKRKQSDLTETKYRQELMKPVISCEQLIAASEKYVNDIRKDAHARYLSWEHCYAYFQKHRKDPTEEEKDFMCLHLAWYLASWGMLRGGAFLLWKDYKVHLPVINLLIAARYEELNGCSAETLCDAAAVSKIMELSDKITEIYWDETSKNGEGKKASDTLITKILLGTLGCTPAYDRYFKSGLSLSGVAHQSYGRKSLLQLSDFYVQNKEKLEDFRKRISEGRIEYTPMKVIDMCFWQTGFDADPDKENY